LADLKEFDPKLARETRKKLRESGDDVIAEMRGVLGGPSPGVVTRRIVERTRRPDGSGALRFRLTGVETAAASRSVSRGARARTAAGLKTRVVAGTTRQSIRLTGLGDPFARSYNLMSWRHPVFRTGTWVEQGGRPYFGTVVLRRSKEISNNVDAALTSAINQVTATRAQIMEDL
jgi:hypothetical protein